MKRYFFIISVVVLLSTSTSLGLVAMNHGNSHEAMSCPFLGAVIGDCALVQNALGLVLSHVSAFSHIFSAIPVNLLILFSLSLLGAFAYLTREKLTFLPSFSANHFPGYPVFPRKHFLDHWLSLHENSPTFFSQRK